MSAVVHPGFMMIEWQTPVVLWLLPVLLAVALIAVVIHMLRARRLTSLQSLARLSSESSSGLSIKTHLLTLVGISLLLIGIAGPLWGAKTSPATAPHRDLVLVLDLSRSMLANDVLPSRSARSSQAIVELCNHLEQRGNVRLALVGFASQGRLLCPLTHDYAHVRETVQKLDPAAPPGGIRGHNPEAVSGTRIGKGILAAIEALEPSSAPFADVLLISDGDDPGGDQEWRTGAQAALQEGIRIHTVGIGNPEQNWNLELPSSRGGKISMKPVSTSLHEDVLREIASSTGGVYVPARTRPFDLAELYERAMEPMPRREATSMGPPAETNRQIWFIAAALLILGLDALGIHAAPWRWRRAKTEASEDNQAIPGAPLVLLVLIVCVAANPHETARSHLRAAYDAYQENDFAEASSRFGLAKNLSADPGLAALGEGSAAYRQRQYEQALVCARQCLEDSMGPRRARALFLQGLCQLRLANGRREPLRRAAGSFAEILSLDDCPRDLAEQARHNLELARMLLAAAGGQNDRPPEGDQEPDPANPKNAPGREQNRGPDGKEPGQPDRIPDKADQTGREDPNAEATPGVGNLPLILGEGTQGLSREGALAILSNAEKRIMTDLQIHRRRVVIEGPGPQKDW